MTRFTSLFLAVLLTAAGVARAEDAKPVPFKPAFLIVLILLFFRSAG